MGQRLLTTINVNTSRSAVKLGLLKASARGGRVISNLPHHPSPAGHNNNKY